MTVLNAGEKRKIASAADSIAALPEGVAAIKGSVRLGPFVIEYSMNEEKAKVTAQVRVGPLRAKILSGTLTRSKNSIKGDASAGVVKASLGITADFKRMKLNVKGKVCHKVVVADPIPRAVWKCHDYSNTVG